MDMDTDRIYRSKCKHMDGVIVKETSDDKYSSQPQCKFFVVRKKRLCRMTVRPGRDYCGEHEPQPKTGNGNDDIRVPCPYDPKHTCYASKLLKHLAVCNGRQTDTPDYIIPNINMPLPLNSAPRRQLSCFSQQKILALIDKVNNLYDKYVKDTITTAPDWPIHDAVIADFTVEGRTETSRRHLRQASSLLHMLEAERLVQDGTCYVELGAGKGHLSYYAYTAWCVRGSGSVLLVDRAALRHKRDNKLRENRAPPGACAGAARVRADLAHLALHKVPQVAASGAVVGFAKHLCGVATDYALRCLTGEGEVEGASGRVRGAVLATCCHHRCEPAAYVGARHLQEMGITAEELDIMLGAVSWATCGDGRSRSSRSREDPGADEGGWAARAAAGRRAKALLDQGRARYLAERGFDARLCHYVSPDVSLENVAIVASKTERGT